MAWPYQFLDNISDEYQQERRNALDHYANYAQLSILIPILIFQLYRLGSWALQHSHSAKAVYTKVPSSPVTKELSPSKINLTVKGWRRVIWWSDSEISPDKGTRFQWIVGVCWACWLLFLCFSGTRHDYLHLTKRFGVVAASQLPFHYLLSMKSIISPFAFIFRSSHEQLNDWHRICGRIVYLLLVCHGSLYLNFYVQKGIFIQRLESRVVIIGLTALILFTVITATSLPELRRYSYRVFFVLHLSIGVSLLPLLFFHVKQTRLYVVEALAIFLVDLIFRKIQTTTGFAKIVKVSNTDLLQLTISVPKSKIGNYQKYPGQHVYLSIPPASRPAGLQALMLYEVLHNPFTIANVSSNHITIVMRVLQGPVTKTLHALTDLWKAKPPVNIEGPYGLSNKFPNLPSTYDRILLVAGGVGAAYIVPMYNAIRKEIRAANKTPECIRFVWAMRSAAQAAWAADLLDEPKNVDLFITGDNPKGRENSEGAGPDGRSVELKNVRRKPQVLLKRSVSHERPRFGEIVDETFRLDKDERVAVLVCGPKDMARDLRESVGIWVAQGREVWYHEEGFGW